MAVREEVFRRGDVEACLEASGEVRAAFVVGRRNGGAARLTAYVEPNEEHTNAFRLRSRVLKSLPAGDMPSEFVVVKAFPRTPVGTIDETAVLRLYGETTRFAVTHVPPTTATERHVLNIWLQVFECDCLGIDDNFFELGGGSLQGMRILASIAESLGAEIAIIQLFEHPTVRLLSAAIDESRSTAGVVL